MPMRKRRLLKRSIKLTKKQRPREVTIKISGSAFQQPKGMAETPKAPALTNGLTGQGVPHDVAARIGDLPPVGSLFASFLGYNPIGSLLGPSGVLDRLPADRAATLTGKEFFPHLMTEPFHHGLVIVFTTAAVMMVVAAVASWAAGGRYVHEEVSDAAAGEALGREQ